MNRELALGTFKSDLQDAVDWFLMHTKDSDEADYWVAWLSEKVWEIAKNYKKNIKEGE